MSDFENNPGNQPPSLGGAPIDSESTPPPHGGPPPPFQGQPVQEGPAWEDESQPLIGRFIATVKSVFTSPGQFFGSMPPTGNFGKAFVFALIGGSIGTIISQIYGMVLNVSLLGFIGNVSGNEDFAVQMAGNAIGGVCGIILAPVAVAFGLFIGAGILHVLLMLFKGANEPFEATFRVVAYASGSLALLNIVPICGGPIYIVWLTVVEIIALAAVHRCGTGKAVAAVLLPFVLCCACLGGLFAIGFGAAFMAASNGGF